MDNRKTQYLEYLTNNPDSTSTYEEWLHEVWHYEEWLKATLLDEFED